MSRIEPDISWIEVTPRPNTSNSNDTEALPNEQFSRSSTGVLENTYAQELSRTLNLMRLAGIYYGETNLVDFPSSSCRRHILGWLYSCFVVFTLWIMLSTYVVNLAYAIEGSSLREVFFSLLLFCYNLLCTGNATICVFVLPIGRRKPSRFERFLSRLACTISESKSRNRKGNKAFWFVILALLVNSVWFYADLVPQTDSASFHLEPWDQWSSSIKIIPRTCLAFFGNVAIVTPIYLFYNVCSILSDQYEDLEKKVDDFINSGSFRVKVFRAHHKKLLTVVELADKALSPLVLQNLVCCLPLVLFIFHHLATFPSPAKDNMVDLVILAYFGSCILAILALFLWCASRLNERIHGFNRILQQSSFSPADPSESCELLRVLLHLQGEPLGLTVGGLVVITKSFSWTVFGALISYFAVLLSLPQVSL